MDPPPPPPIPRPRTRHRRQSSVATSYAQEDLPRDRRQSSQVTSWYADNLDEDDETTYSRGRTRWGKVGERSFRESLRSTSSKSPLSYHECNLRKSFFTIFLIGMPFVYNKHKEKGAFFMFLYSCT